MLLGHTDSTYRDSDQLLFPNSVWFLGRSLPVSSLCFFLLLLLLLSRSEGEITNDKSAFLHPISLTHNAACSNEVIIIHITDIKRNELKSLDV